MLDIMKDRQAGAACITFGEEKWSGSITFTLTNLVRTNWANEPSVVYQCHAKDKKNVRQAGIQFTTGPINLEASSSSVGLDCKNTENSRRH